jgi:hypothetical protein
MGRITPLQIDVQAVQGVHAQNLRGIIGQGVSTKLLRLHGPLGRALIVRTI